MGVEGKTTIHAARCEARSAPLPLSQSWTQLGSARVVVSSRNRTPASATECAEAHLRSEETLCNNYLGKNERKKAIHGKQEPAAGSRAVGTQLVGLS